MVKRMLALFVTGLALFWTSFVVQAAEPDWTAWLYNPANGEMTQIDNHGKVVDGFILPLPASYEFYPFEIAVAPNGTRVAYIASQGDTRRLLVYNVVAKRLIVDYSLPAQLIEGTEFVFESALKFNETASALAVSYSLKDGGWQVAILDPKTTLVTLILRDSTASAVPSDDQTFPVVQHYQGTKVYFTMVEINAKSQPERGSYVWDTTANMVTLALAYATLDNDLFIPTGEIVTAQFNPDLPHQNELFASQQVNALYVYDPTADAHYPFYTAPNVSLYFPRFIQNGQRLLVGTFDPQGKPGWVVIERDGAFFSDWGAPAGTVVGSLVGTADGFIYTANTVNPGGGHATLLEVNTQDGITVSAAASETGTPIWSSTGDAYPRLVSVQDRRLSGQGPFKLWAHL